MDLTEGMEQRLSDIRGITLKSLLENAIFLQPPSNNSEDGKIDKEAGLVDFDDNNEDTASAFLGPALWEKTHYDDLKLEYMDLDEFLMENGISTNGGKNEDEKAARQEELSKSSSPGSSPGSSPAYEISAQPSLSLPAAVNLSSPTLSPLPQPHSTSPSLPPAPAMSPVRAPTPPHSKVPFTVTETDAALATAPGQDKFDPKECTFTKEELKPQAMVKKSCKVYVPNEQKDMKYWERRRKNNIAAKRSRDARRIKQNQIVIRTAYLEKENDVLKSDIFDLKNENSTLKNKIAIYEKRLNGLKMD